MAQHCHVPSHHTRWWDPLWIWPVRLHQHAHWVQQAACHILPYFSGTSYCKILAPVWHHIVAQLTAQVLFHTYCFYVLITGPHAHIMLWDQSNVVVTEQIEYNSDDLLVKFFSWFLQAPPGLHGVDTSWLVQPQAPKLLSVSPLACQGRKMTSVCVYPALREPVLDFTSSQELVQVIHDALVGGSCLSSSVCSPTLLPIPSAQRGIWARILPLGLYPLEHQHHPQLGLSDWLGPGEIHQHKPTQPGHMHGVQPYLSTLCHACLLTSLHIQDITVFLSICHINDQDQPPTLQDDLKSIFWVLLWIVLAYLDLLLCPWELHWFMVVTLGQKLNMGDFTQKNVVVRKLSDEDLFPDYPLLKYLLLDLAQLFCNHSDTSSTREHRPVASERLQNHDEVIGWFEHYLQQENWSTGERCICTHSDHFYVWDQWMLLWRLGIAEYGWQCYARTRSQRK